MNLLQQIENENTSARQVDFAVGDEVRVHVKLKDADKTRIQVFEGTIIAIKGAGPSMTFTVRKTSFGVGVERVFPVHTPSVDRVEIKSRHSVRRSKLYFLRERSGKSARLKELAHHS